MKYSHAGPLRSARGAALVTAMLVLLVLAVLATGLLTTINLENKITGHHTRGIEALNRAEAGVAEAMARLRSGEIPDSLNPRMVAQIFLTSPGSVPVLGADSVALATAQPAGKWLSYSTPRRGPGVLTVSYKTNPAKTTIFRYDAVKNPAVQTATGQPIFVITSTGSSGSSTRTIVSEVIRKPLNVNLLGAISVRSSTTKLWCGAMTHGPFMYNGMNHRADTPTGASVWGPEPQYYAGSGNMPAMWSVSPISYGGNYPAVCCTPQGTPGPILENQPAAQFYPGPWAALGMGQAEFFNWIGPARTTVPASITGITYLDNNAIKGDRSGSWTMSGVTGEGFLYADGNVTVNGDFTWRGLIYTEGKFTISGNVWILGGLVVADPSQFEVAHKRCTFLYSRDAIVQSISRFRQDFISLNWREL